MILNYPNPENEAHSVRLELFTAGNEVRLLGNVSLTLFLVNVFPRL